MDTSRAIASLLLATLTLASGSASADFRVRIPMGNVCAGGGCAGGNTPPPANNPPTQGADTITMNDFKWAINMDDVDDRILYHWSSTTLPSATWGETGVITFTGGSAVNFAAVANVSYQFEYADGTPITTVNWVMDYPNSDPAFGFAYSAAENKLTLGASQLSAHYSGAAADLWTWVDWNMVSAYAPLVAAARTGNTVMRIRFLDSNGQEVAASQAISIGQFSLASNPMRPGADRLLTNQP